MCLQADGSATPFLLADYATAFERAGHKVTVVEREDVQRASKQGVTSEFVGWIRDSVRPDFVLGYDYWPFFPCLSENGEHISPSGLEAARECRSLLVGAGLRTVSVFGDDPFIAFGAIERPADVFAQDLRADTHFTFSWSPLSLESLRAAGVDKCELLPLAYNPRRPALPARRGSELPRTRFVGSFTKRRARCLEPLGGLDFGVYGDDAWRSFDGLAPNYRGRIPYGTRTLSVYSAPGVNVDVAAYDGYWLGQRPFDVWGSGGFLISERVDGIERVFDDDFLVCFERPDELYEQVSYYLDNEAERTRISEQRQQVIRARHTYDVRAASMIDMLTRVGFI